MEKLHQSREHALVTESLTPKTSLNASHPASAGRHQQDVRNRAAAQFLDLGLITAKRLITRRWKSSDPPVERAWKSSFEVWAGAEGVALAREDALGLRKYPLSVSWEAMLACLRGLGQNSDVEMAV
ncbi:hypothetical protein NDU88_002920 [Pleurodeles waltl]|uniref:Uncharacterized protein n=1 Tax=Pleurodeles waltl TaxID=8319 RepID=A0AAV7T3H0_PLEWA|nr:hypothetical protein NDU88_002920 [Pleurodeles waltl]